MSAVEEKHLIQVIKDKCTTVGEDLVPGYSRDILKTLVEILSAERNNVINPTNIQQKVSASVETLGQIISELDSNKEEHE